MRHGVPLYSYRVSGEEAAMVIVRLPTAADRRREGSYDFHCRGCGPCCIRTPWERHGKRVAPPWLKG